MSKVRAEPVSLRELKRAMTRKTILEASQRLFAEQGYDATTLEQICAEALISVPTLLAYFETKDRLALALEYDELEEFQRRLADPARDELTIDLWRHRIDSGAEGNMKKRRNSLAYMKFTESSSSLIRHYVYLLTQYEEALGQALAVDHEVDYNADLPTRLMATMLVWGHRAVLLQWRAEGGRTDLRAKALAVIDIAEKQYASTIGRVSV
jgi:AcrR family transcriptional regulator